MISYFRNLPANARNVAIALMFLPGIIVLYVVITMTGWFLQSNEQIVDLEPRIARLQGYLQSEDRLRESALAVESQLADIVYPASQDSASTGAALQQQIRQYMESAGFNVSGSQLLAMVDHEAFEEIRVNISATGSMPALDQLLTDLQQARPLLLVRAINLSRGRALRGDNEQDITLTITISAVRLL